VTRGLAGMKFSGSPRMFGLIRIVEIININVINIPKISFDEK